MTEIPIKEIFTSIQGEGPFVGCKQIFVRFCKCNLSCKYCDTDFGVNNDTKSYTAKSLAEYINDLDKNCHSVSLTGGEPLLETEFLKEFLPLCKFPIYLETNATLPEKLEEIIEYIDYVSADIKLPSTTGLKEKWEIHDKFFDVAKNKKLFAKIVFDETITRDEIYNSCKLAEKYGIELILQPKMKGQNFAVKREYIEKIFEEFIKIYKNVRLIPQVHKFLDIM